MDLKKNVAQQALEPLCSQLCCSVVVKNADLSDLHQ
jgi:hypothetical protein